MAQHDYTGDLLNAASIEMEFGETLHLFFMAGVRDFDYNCMWVRVDNLFYILGDLQLTTLMDVDGWCEKWEHYVK